MGLALALWQGRLPEALQALWGLLPLALEVGAILLGGVYFHLAVAQRGEGLAQWAQGIKDPVRRALFLASGLIPFFGSVTGFGIGVVLGLPLLLRLGHPPARAAALALLGLVLVPWGALAPGTLVAARLGGVGLGALGMASALYTLPVLPAAGLGTLRLAGLLGPQAPPGRPWAWLLLGSLLLWGLLLLAQGLLSTPRRGWRQASWPPSSSGACPPRRPAGA